MHLCIFEQYKYKCGVGEEIRLQGNSHKDIIFVLKAHPATTYTSTPMCNLVGFGDLTSTDVYNNCRTLIMLGTPRALDLSFEFRLKPTSS